MPIQLRQQQLKTVLRQSTGQKAGPGWRTPCYSIEHPGGGDPAGVWEPLGKCSLGQSLQAGCQGQAWHWNALHRLERSISSSKGRLQSLTWIRQINICSPLCSASTLGNKSNWTTMEVSWIAAWSWLVMWPSTTSSWMQCDTTQELANGEGLFLYEECNLSGWDK